MTPTRSSVRAAGVAAILVCLGPALAHAQGDAPAAPSSVALPGMHRVLSGAPVRGVAAFTGLGYGRTSDVFGIGDVHQRAQGALSVAAGLGGWLALSLRFDGRYDRHGGVIEGMPESSDDGWVGDPRVALQVSRRLTDTLRASGTAVLWLPGGNAPSLVTDAISSDLLASVSYLTMSGRLRVAANLGFRLDRSAASAQNADLLSRSDRLSLGVSESDAVLVGLGLGLRMGRAEIFAEWTMDKLLPPDGQPDTSPMRVAAGLCLGVSESMAARVVVESNLGTMPLGKLEHALAPFDPRLVVLAGLHYRFGGARKPERLGTGELVDADKPDVPVDPPAPATVSGRALAEDGSPLAGARVELTSKTGETRSATTDQDGRYRIDDVPPGASTVTITAEGFDPVTREIEVAAGAAEDVQARLPKTLPKGQLRGVVRAFSGKGIRATVVVEPIGEKTATDENGEFEIDVPPGEYTVSIEADGFQGQRRQVSVPEDGVTIIQVDMRQKRR